jgi:hypothetical protein
VTRVVARAQAIADELVETERLGPATSMMPFTGVPTAILPHRAGDVVGRDRLDARR